MDTLNEEMKCRDDVARFEAALKFAAPEHVVLIEMLRADLRRAECRLSSYLEAMEASD